MKGFAFYKRRNARLNPPNIQGVARLRINIGYFAIYVISTCCPHTTLRTMAGVAMRIPPGRRRYIRLFELYHTFYRFYLLPAPSSRRRRISLSTPPRIVQTQRYQLANKSIRGLSVFRWIPRNIMRAANGMRVN